MDRIARILDESARRLEAERAQIKAKLRSYPAPIPACDANYNHLAEERRRLSGALARLAELRRELAAVPDQAQALALLRRRMPALVGAVAAEA